MTSVCHSFPCTLVCSRDQGDTEEIPQPTKHHFAQAYELLASFVTIALTFSTETVGHLLRIDTRLHRHSQMVSEKARGSEQLLLLHLPIELQVRTVVAMESTAPSFGETTIHRQENSTDAGWCQLSLSSPHFLGPDGDR